MKKLIIVRHGDYDHTGNLSDYGRRQIESLTDKVREHINGDRALILFSTKPRAVQSAEILSNLLKVESEAHAILVSEGGMIDRPKALEFVRKHKDRADVLILVTHLEYGEDLPFYFGHHELGLPPEQKLDGYGIKKGEAWVIDCTAKKMVRLVPTS